ncbi:MAG: hypothetical protein HKN78_03360 [Sphingomonadaceae bacterium]|nr:hypothetical protein [Sphingomonadaceae bacterium]
MQQRTVESVEQSGVGATMASMAASDGSSGHRYLSSAEFNTDAFAARNLADAVHYLCLLHGRYPGVVDFAAERTANPGSHDWLTSAVDGFAHERIFLAQLISAAGPQPSTAGHTQAEQAVLAQRHAIETLAQSERTGCALGAAVALVLDWHEIRAVLNAAAAKLSVDIPELTLPDGDAALAVVDAIGETSAIRRAIVFGAEQVFTQQRGLWDLLEAREAAREDW